MKRFVQVFGVPLILTAGLSPGDTPPAPVASGPADYGQSYSLAPLPGMLGQVLAPKSMLSEEQRAPNPTLERALRVAQAKSKTTMFKPQSLRGPGDAIPPCYMVFGYGRDKHGQGPYLDASGNALPLTGNPRTVPVWNFTDSAAGKRPLK